MVTTGVGTYCGEVSGQRRDGHNVTHDATLADP